MGVRTPKVPAARTPPRGQARWSLLTRLLASAVALLAAVSLVMGIAGVVALDTFLTARLDDQLTVGLEVEKLTRVRVIFRQHVRRGDEELVTGTVEIACVDMASMRPAPIPQYLYQQLETLK